MMAIAGIIPVAKWLAKIKQRSDVSCRLCKQEREQRGASTENLPEEKYGHIMASTVLSAMEWQQSSRLPTTSSGDICTTAQTPTSKLRFVTPDKESSMSTLWQEEEFKQICSRESLMENAAKIEKMIVVVKDHERARYDFNPTMFYENRFWNRRTDGTVINKK